MSASTVRKYSSGRMTDVLLGFRKLMFERRINQSIIIHKIIINYYRYL
jgi:hypothetical protein